MKDLSLIEQLVQELTTNEKQVLLNRLTSVRRKKEKEPEIYDVEKLIQDTRFQEDVCVHCGCTHTVKYGKVGEHQRYRCKDCGKTFISTCRSTFYRTHLDVWQLREYLDCLMLGLTIRKSASRCGISIRTSFRWRHRILDLLEHPNKDVKLKGVVEADETFFKISFKGNAKNHILFYGRNVEERREYRKKHPLSKRNAMKEHVCVCCGLSKDKTSLSRATNINTVTYQSLHRTFDETLDKNALLCSDKHRAYRVFAEDNDVNLLQFKGDKTEARTGEFNIQRINHYHASLKMWMHRFYGVASKYLNNYLLWYNFIFYTRNLTSINDLLRLFAKEVNDDKISDVQKRFYFPPTLH